MDTDHYTFFFFKYLGININSAFVQAVGMQAVRMQDEDFNTCKPSLSDSTAAAENYYRMKKGGCFGTDFYSGKSYSHLDFFPLVLENFIFTVSFHQFKGYI